MAACIRRGVHLWVIRSQFLHPEWLESQLLRALSKEIKTPCNHRRQSSQQPNPGFNDADILGGTAAMGALVDLPGPFSRFEKTASRLHLVSRRNRTDLAPELTGADSGDPWGPWGSLEADPFELAQRRGGPCFNAC